MSETLAASFESIRSRHLVGSAVGQRLRRFDGSPPAGSIGLERRSMADPLSLAAQRLERSAGSGVDRRSG